MYIYIYIYTYTYTYMWLLSQGAECNMGNIFQLSHILLAKYEKRGKYCQYCSSAITTLSLNAC